MTIVNTHFWVPDFEIGKFFVDCTNWEQLLRKTRSLLQPFGVEGINYGVCHSLQKARNCGLLNAVETWTDYPRPFLKKLVETGLGAEDFSARYIVEHHQPFFWAHFERYEGATPLERERFALDDEFNFNVGATFPVWRTEYAGSGFGIWTPSLSADEFDRMWIASSHEIMTVAAGFDIWIRKNGLKERYKLTQREKDVLAFTGGGMGSSQIARHLGVSSRTVEGALARARERLKSQNTTEAVAKALIFNLI